MYRGWLYVKFSQLNLAREAKAYWQNIVLRCQSTDVKSQNAGKKLTREKYHTKSKHLRALEVNEIEEGGRRTW